MDGALGSRRDRRLDRRHTAIAGHRILGARIRPGHHATIVNVSAGGALLDTTFRMLPGAVIDVQLERADYRAVLRACVTRCAVERLEPSRILYRGAVTFDARLRWLSDESVGYSIPGRDSRSSVKAGEALPGR
jgi:hypothetical protein